MGSGGYGGQQGGGGGGWSGGGSKRERVRLSERPLAGRVLEWKGQYGWIQPLVLIKHPQVDKHRGRIYIHNSDIKGKWRALKVGSIVGFLLYDDGDGLGAEKCEARKVLRVTMTKAEAQAILGENGEGIKAVEEKHSVVMRAYQWSLPDGSDGEMPFIMMEVWGTQKSAAGCVTELSGKEKDRAIKLLVPESRCWNVDLSKLSEVGAQVELSQGMAIVDPMPCRSLSVQGTSDQVDKALRLVIAQTSDS